MARRRTREPSAGELQDRVLEHLRVLRIPLSGDELDAALRRAEQEQMSHLALLDLLLGKQAAQRRERSVERRIYQANFRDRKTLETFDWDFNKKVINRVDIEQLATGDFIRRNDNLVFVGQSGVGKSHLIQAIGIRACAVGYRVRYTTSAALIADLNASLADKTFAQRVRKYVRPEMLIIDEFGFEKIEREECSRATSLLYKVVDARSGRSTALVTNVNFDAWADYLGDPPLAMAFLDRLVDGAIVLKIKGRSYRAARTRKPKSSK
jgi:DNA replication protein DnaC